jgi:hypothetical protein
MPNKENPMALLERVSTLLRANLNDLIEKAEDPERLLKQIVLDMENQLLQVKTQVAIAIADQHLLDKKRAEHVEQAAEWRRKAELAVQKGHDDLARAALERALSHDQLVAGFTEQAEDQKSRGRQPAPGPAQAGPEAERDARPLRNAGGRASPRPRGGPRHAGSPGDRQRSGACAGPDEEPRAHQVR